ncbi:unnamed protein product [Closterium sp. Yama58-4]|nr:unnamed protein product [Closterium sp. Yama58-4]
MLIFRIPSRIAAAPPCAGRSATTRGPPKKGCEGHSQRAGSLPHCTSSPPAVIPRESPASRRLPARVVGAFIPRGCALVGAPFPMSSSSHHHSARASLRSRWHGGAHKAGYGIRAAHVIQACAFAIVTLWLCYHWSHAPRRQPPRDADPAAASAGRLQVRGLVVERPKPKYVARRKSRSVISLEGPGDRDLLPGDGALADAEGARGGGAALAGGDIVRRIVAKAGMAQARGVKLKDLVEAKAQGGGNLLGEFGGEAEEGERAWEEEGELEERALVDLKGGGREAKVVQRALDETRAVEGDGGGEGGAEGEREGSAASALEVAEDAELGAGRGGADERGAEGGRKQQAGRAGERQGEGGSGRLFKADVRGEEVAGMEGEARGGEEEKQGGREEDEDEARGEEDGTVLCCNTLHSLPRCAALPPPMRCTPSPHALHSLPPCAALPPPMRCTPSPHALHSLPPCAALPPPMRCTASPHALHSLPPCAALPPPMRCTASPHALHSLPPCAALPPPMRCTPSPHALHSLPPCAALPPPMRCTPSPHALHSLPPCAALPPPMRCSPSPHALHSLPPCAALPPPMRCTPSPHALHCLPPCAALPPPMRCTPSPHALHSLPPCAALPPPMRCTASPHALHSLPPCAALPPPMRCTPSPHALHSLPPCAALPPPMRCTASPHALHSLPPCAALPPPMRCTPSPHALHCLPPCAALPPPMRCTPSPHALHSLPPCAALPPPMRCTPSPHALHSLPPCAALPPPMRCTASPHALHSLPPCAALPPPMRCTPSPHALHCLPPCAALPPPMRCTPSPHALHSLPPCAALPPPMRCTPSPHALHSLPPCAALPPPMRCTPSPHALHSLPPCAALPPPMRCTPSPHALHSLPPCAALPPPMRCTPSPHALHSLPPCAALPPPMRCTPSPHALHSLPPCAALPPPMRCTPSPHALHSLPPCAALPPPMRCTPSPHALHASRHMLCCAALIARRLCLRYVSSAPLHVCLSFRCPFFRCHPTYLLALHLQVLLSLPASLLCNPLPFLALLSRPVTTLPPACVQHAAASSSTAGAAPLRSATAAGAQGELHRTIKPTASIPLPTCCLAVTPHHSTPVLSNSSLFLPRASACTATHFSHRHTLLSLALHSFPSPSPHPLQIRDSPVGWYGGGERFNAVNQKGNVLPMASRDTPSGNQAERTYKAVPFVMSTSGWGVWVDSHAQGSFLLNHASHPHHMVLRYPLFTSLRVVFMGGPRLLGVLALFSRLSASRPIPPPLWALAPWKGRDVHRTSQEVLEDAEKLRQQGIPGSVILIDSPWETSYNDFSINRQQFDDPQTLFSKLHALGFRVVFWATPFINLVNRVDMRGITPTAAPNYHEAAQHGFLVRNATGHPQVVRWWKGRGARVDLSSAQAERWWRGQMGRMLQWEEVFGGVKADDGEGAFFEAGAVFHDGTPLELMRNKYIQLYLASMQRFINKSVGATQGVVLARSAFTGTASSFVWAGDNRASFSRSDGLPSVVVAGQTAALSALFLWGSDIAGYLGKAIPRNVFIRWTQFGALSPLMHQFGQANNGPWDYDALTLRIYRRFARLHTTLAPYLLRAARLACSEGRPVMCPMALCAQGDEAAESGRWEGQYLLGGDLLVAPVVNETDSVQVLPDDTHTLVPCGAHILPSVKCMPSHRTIQVWPGGAGSTELCVLLRVSHRYEGTVTRASQGLAGGTAGSGSSVGDGSGDSRAAHSGGNSDSTSGGTGGVKKGIELVEGERSAGGSFAGGEGGGEGEAEAEEGGGLQGGGDGDAARGEGEGVEDLPQMDAAQEDEGGGGGAEGEGKEESDVGVRGARRVLGMREGAVPGLEAGVQGHEAGVLRLRSQQQQGEARGESGGRRVVEVAWGGTARREVHVMLMFERVPHVTLTLLPPAGAAGDGTQEARRVPCERVESLDRPLSLCRLHLEKGITRIVYPV